MNEKGIGTVSIVIIIAVIVVGVAGATLWSSGAHESLTLTGSTTVRPLAKKWAEEYLKENPDVKIEISGGGSGKGVADVKAGRVDIGMSSSEGLIEKEEDLLSHVIAYDGIIVVVNKDFPGLETLMQEEISKSTLREIYSGEITNWNQVPGVDIGHELNNYRRSEASGTAETFAGFLEMTQDELDGAGQRGNAGMKSAIESNKYSLGFIGAAYAFSGNIEEVPVDGNDDGKIEDHEKIEDYEDLKSDIGNYPIKRGLYFATKGQPTGLAGNFIDWCKDQGQKYVSEIGYIPISGVHGG